MADRRSAAFDYSEGCIAESKRTVSFERRYNAVNFRIPFRINWTIILTIMSISVCQFVESVAERQVSSSHGKEHYDQHRSERSVRRSMVPSQTLQSVAEDPALTPQDVLSRLEAAAVLRDNLVTTLGRVLLLCLNDDVRIPLEQIHNAARNYRVAVYEFLPVLPALRNKLPKQQLYKLLQMLERVDNRFVSEYASLCISAFSDVDAALEQVPLADMLLDIDQEVIESVSRDKQRAGVLHPSLAKGIDFLLQAARNGDEILNLRAVSAILLNYPVFDLTDPEVHNAIRFIAQRLKERSGSEDALLQYMGPNLENTTNFLKTLLERLETDEQSSETTREATSLLLQNFNVKPYPSTPNRKDNSKKLLVAANDYYPLNAAAVAKYLLDHLDDSHLQALDIGFYETGDHALLQVLSRLRRQSHLRHLRKPLSLLIPFVSQKLANDANYDYTAPVSFYEVNDYLDAFDTPCLQPNISDAMKMLRPHLSEDLPWTYAFGDRRVSDDPWELILTSLIHLRNVPVNESQAKVIDNFIYKGHVNGLTPRRGLLYDSGIIFQRDDSADVEVDIFSLLMRIPDAFRSEKFTPVLNFMSKRNILNILSYEFNKFEHETPRNLLLAMLKRARTLPLVKSDEPLARALQNTHDYLEEPLLINLYISEDLQLLLKNLPYIDSDPRYLPLKILFKKRKLFTHLSSTFSLADVHTPMERLLLILKTVSLKTAQPKLSEALSLAVNNVNGPPLPIKTFDRSDFVYLVQQLLSRNESLQNEILKSYVYTNVGDWNISISGTPENVLARALSSPINYISSDGNLASLTKRALNILEEEVLINTEILKKQTLEAMLEYLPNNTYVKPVILLLRKANLMMLVPKLDLATLEGTAARDALIMLLKSLTESRIIRAEKLLLRRVRVALSSLDGNSGDDRQTPLFAYLIQSLQDPSNAIYQPLLLEISKLHYLTISPDERQAWLQSYFQEIIDKNETENLTMAASMMLKEITHDESLESRASKERIGKAVSLLPADPFVKPLRRLLTPDWAYSILPEKLRNSDSLEKEELLQSILHHAKQQVNVADSSGLTRAIFKIEANLKGSGTDIESLRSAVAAMKAAVYDPVRKLLNAAGLNKIKVTVPTDKSAKTSLLGLLHRLLLHPVVKKNNDVLKLLSAVKEDVVSFGVDVDLLTVLDNVGIADSNELAPIRLFLHRRDVNEKFGRTVFAVADPKKRYRTLLHILQRQHQNNDTRFFDALSTLRNIQPNEREADTLISDLEDIVNAIPHRDRQRFESIEYLFNADTLSRLTDGNEIVESNTPLITLLSKIADLPEVNSNNTAMNKLNKLQLDVVHLNYPIVTGFQLRPLLLELGHVQQINVDYLNSILNPEILSYLNPEEMFGTSNNNIDILQNIIDYLLHEGPAFVDDDMQRHLQSFKRVLKLTIGSSKPSKRDLTKEDWKKMLNLIPHKKDFAPIKNFLQTKEILKYIKYEDTDWKMFSTPVKKLLHLLSLMDNNEIENENVYKVANRLRRNLEKRYNFITEKDVKSMHRTLTSLKLKYDLAPLKIFLNHNNMIKYLPPDFKYTIYSTSIDAFAAVLDNLLRFSSLRRKVILYKTMTFVRQALRERISPARRSFRRALVRNQLSSNDLEFVSQLNMSLPKVREFFKPEKLASLLPESFTFDNQPTFKTKALHLLRQLLKSDTGIHSELEGLVREVENYPDVPEITKDDLVPLMNILPVEGIPYVGLIKKYLKPSTLIKLLPGNFNIKQVNVAKDALHDVLSLLSVTLGSTMDDKLKIALDALIRESIKISSNVIPRESIVDSDDIRSIIKEIPFQYRQIEPLKAQMTTRRVVSSLPLNFQLTEYETMKLRVLAVLDELSRSKQFQSSLYSINFAIRVVSKMPDMPIVNDTEIEKLLLPLQLNIFYVKLLVKNCKVAALMPYLPIYFNLSGIKSRKMKLGTILRYCKLANPTDVSTRQALANAETLLKASPDIDITRDHVEVLIRAIPCAHFTSLKPLLRFLSKTDVASLLPWDLDLYRTSRTFKQRIFDLLTAMRNVRELQTDEIFSAIDSLEVNARSLPEQVYVPPERLTNLYNSSIVAFAPCSDYRDYVLKLENLIQILPPNFHFQLDYQTSSVTSHSEWARLMRFSALFLRDVIDGPVKTAFEACKDNVRKFEKEQIFTYLSQGLNYGTFQQLVPLRLYTLGHAEDITVPVEDIYRTFPYGSIFSMLRVMMREFIRRSDLIKSKSLISDMEVFLHDYLVMLFRVWSVNLNEMFNEIPSPYEINQAIGEIPGDREYDDLRLLTQCQDIQTPMERTILPEDTPKQLLLQMLEQAENGDIDAAIRQSIQTLKPHLVSDIHAEEVEYVLKQMRDYRYHASKVDSLRKYLVSRGLSHVLGQDFSTKYPNYKDRLFAINDIVLTNTMNKSTGCSPECRAASEHLNRTLHNEIKIEHIVPRTMDDINVQSLFFALPKTRDERIIRGIIEFFSIPNLLRKLKLPRDPFEYVTKGRLLQAIVDLGQKLESVQQDPVQQEALGYFRDKITIVGPGAQPIELKKYAYDSNVDVDMYGVMRAIDYAKINESDAVKVAMFFERKYDSLVHAMDFERTAYATRGSYLKALFEHLVNVSVVPDDVKQQITSLIPAVRLDGPGEESVDLNTDIFHEETPSMRMFGEFLDAKSLKPVTDIGTKISHSFYENKESLNAAVDNILETIPSSEEYLEHVIGQSNVYEDKTRVVIGAPQHLDGTARRKLNLGRPRMQGTSNSREVLATGTKKKKNDRSTKNSPLNDIAVPRNEARVKYKIAKKAKCTMSKNNLSQRTQSSGHDYFSDKGDNSSPAFEEQLVESLPTSSQQLLSEEPRKKSHHKPMTRLLIQPDTSIDIEYVNSDGDAPIARILHDVSRNEKSLSLTEELIAEQTKLDKMSKSAKENFCNRHTKKNRNTKIGSR
ncbi:PREDICTED: uncharacterized protein LOC105569512 [Vollenhovia emeryi]|uniref:uncharacterized protein LOC105569512 n=1 Tax=Vollenhovia emeryi TaxID=411798 RepID=UPI0005F54882|nr:PREDICTED: uncharacterized protein LOC105569512 [Vollenhovia emeryi]